ncbi:hypothetical protein [Fusobacterium sp. THCT1E2]
MDLLAFLKNHVPCYIYDGEQITRQCQKLKKELSSFEFLYSIKTNLFSHIIQNIPKEGFGADAASAGEILTGYEPLYTCQDEFSVQVLNESAEKEKVNIVGNLCTALDVIRENAEVNHAQIGDIIEITNAGSYAYSLSPLLFSSHRIPKQYYLYKNKISEDEIL